MSSTFQGLGASAEIAKILSRSGIDTPTPIQAATIPAALDGRDVAGKAPTGSGKTLAFAIPLAQLTPPAEPRRPRALVLVPTRELAAQVQGELRPLLTPVKASVATFYGGVGFGNQTKALRRGVDIAVACPGRLADLIRQGEVSLEDVEIVVLDEADRMADMGFLPEVKRLLDMVQPDRQTLLFSATLDGDVDVLVRRYQHDPLKVDVSPPEAAIDWSAHHFLDVRREHRYDRTAELIAEHGSSVVFCRTRRGADRLAKRLAGSGTKAAAIHGGRSQGQRDRALASFANGKVDALIATDVAARGIHVDDVACVIHFDLPADAKDYIHRSGRTARAGAHGVVMTLVTDQDRSDARKLRRDLGVDGAGDAPAHGKGHANGNGQKQRRSPAKAQTEAANRNGNGQKRREHPSDAEKTDDRSRSERNGQNGGPAKGGGNTPTKPGSRRRRRRRSGGSGQGQGNRQSQGQRQGNGRGGRQGQGRNGHQPAGAGNPSRRRRRRPAQGSGAKASARSGARR